MYHGEFEILAVSTLITLEPWYVNMGLAQGSFTLEPTPRQRNLYSWAHVQAPSKEALLLGPLANIFDFFQYWVGLSLKRSSWDRPVPSTNLCSCTWALENMKGAALENRARGLLKNEGSRIREQPGCIRCIVTGVFAPLAIAIHANRCWHTKTKINNGTAGP